MPPTDDSIDVDDVDGTIFVESTTDAIDVEAPSTLLTLVQPIELFPQARSYRCQTFRAMFVNYLPAVSGGGGGGTFYDVGAIFQLPPPKGRVVV
jgi:hypothetical protein